MIVEARSRDLGEGFLVRRVLPYAKRRMIGPFIFLDHMGPVTFAPGGAMDVRPHPHICLATVTYLFDGFITHRDSLGVEQNIRPGDVNWMTAGRGIVHSERTPPETRAAGQTIHGMQSWVALPVEHEETEPQFHHHPGASLPRFERGGARLTLIAGEAFGETSPAKTFSPMFYLEAILPPGAKFEFDAGESGEAFECACYVAVGSAKIAGQSFATGTLPVMYDGAKFTIEHAGDGEARVMILGGRNIGDRKIFWNFVASTPERIEEAKRAWQDQRFPKIPGDDQEFIPLPD